MKKSLITILCLTLFVACGNKQTKSTVNNNTTDSAIVKTDTLAEFETFDLNKKLELPVSIEEVHKAWEKCFKKGATLKQFLVVDIDHDGNGELFLRNGNEQEGDAIAAFTCPNGTLKCIAQTCIPVAGTNEYNFYIGNHRLVFKHANKRYDITAFLFKNSEIEKVAYQESTYQTGSDEVNFKHKYMIGSNASNLVETTQTEIAEYFNTNNAIDIKAFESWQDFTNSSENHTAAATNDNLHQFAWSGKLGENIYIRLEFESNNEGLVMGETTYFKKNGTTTDIPVLGTINAMESGEQLITLNEYDGTKICGSYYITLKDNTFISGKWYMGDKEYQMNEMVAHDFSFGKHETFFVPVYGNDINGEYSFTYDSGNPSMPEYGGSATLRVNEEKITWTFAQVTPNIAEGEGTSILEGNTFVGKTGSFKFRAWCYKNCVYVKCTNPDEDPCQDFGAFATLDGIYVKK